MFVISFKKINKEPFFNLKFHTVQTGVYIHVYNNKINILI